MMESDRKVVSRQNTLAPSVCVPLVPGAKARGACAPLAPAVVREVFGLGVQLRAQGVAVLMVEQRARQALAISDRGCILDQGRVVLAGPAAGLLADDRMAQLYLGGAH